MAELTGRRISKKAGEIEVEFTLEDGAAVSSSSVRAEVYSGAREAESDVEALPVDAEEYSPEFLTLAVPKLPKLSGGNRARLLMQSPNRLYFYWSIGKNPFHTLNRALGQGSSYTLVLKLVNLFTDEEQIHAVDERGSWWFDVDADSRYRAEIGFYAVNRPYIRVLFSNTVDTPRKSPSPRTADTAEWRVPAHRFATVLEASGFARDAFDVAVAGDDWDTAEIATRSAFAQFSGRADVEFAGVSSDELRYALFALASGAGLEELRGLISERLFSILSSVLGLSAENALAALKDQFDFDAEEFEIEEEVEPVVFGASLVGFPRKTRPVRRPRDLHPISSYRFRSGA